MGKRGIDYAIQLLLCATLMLFTASQAFAETAVEYSFRIILTRDLASITKVQSQLGAGVDFAQLAKEASIDPGTAKNGGFMVSNGKNLRGEFLGELQNLKPGQRSPKPRKSEFGYFVIKLESAKEYEDNSQELMRMHQERRAKQLAAQQEQEKADERLVQAKEKFESCARTAASLDGQYSELSRQVGLFNAGSLSYTEQALRAQERQLKTKAKRFEGECSDLLVNAEVVKVCSHPAYQSRWCEAAVANAR